MYFTPPIEWLIMRRELRGVLRKIWLVLAAALWICAGAFVTYAGWPTETIQQYGLTTSQYVARESRELLVVQFLVMLFALLFTVPPIAAMSFAGERATDTLDQLRLAPIQGGRIVIGKLMGILFITTLYLCAVVPVFAIAQFLLGLDNQQIFSVIVYLVAVTLMIASLGVACATAFRNPTSAVLAAYGMALGVMFVPVLASWSIEIGMELYSSGESYTSGQQMMITLPGNLIPGQDVGGVGVLITVLEMTARVLGPGQVVMGLIDGPMEQIEIAVVAIAPLTISAISLLVAARRLRHDDAPRKRRRGISIHDHVELEARRKKFPFYLIDPLRRSSSIADNQNPVFVREFRFGLFLRTTTMVRAAIGTFAVLALAFSLASLAMRPDYIYLLIMLEIWVLVPFVPALLANAFALERDPGHLDMLRMSLLPARQIVLGKIAGESAALAPLFAAGSLALLSPLATRPECYFPTLAGMITLINCAFAGAAIGITAAIVHKRPQTATVSAMSITFLALVGALALMFIGSFAEPEIWQIVAKRELTSSSLVPVISPVWAYRHFVSHPGVILLEINEYGVPRGAPWWLLSQAIFAGAAMALLMFSTWFFRRYRMQDT
ncbi:MAG: ABC transporter permease [Candidatus Hydrogenedentes bacterium]|nr:ABC transporter permease [Candidatus Hydrogenedentota bacterium]